MRNMVDGGMLYTMLLVTIYVINPITYLTLSLKQDKYIC